MAYYTKKSPGRLVSIKGEDYVYFGGTAYLGLPTNRGFQELLIKNIRRYGSHHGASRVSNLRLSNYEKTEDFLAEWAGSEASLTLSSGFLAGQLLAHYFSRDTYESFYAPNTHTALLPAGKQAYKSYRALSEAVIAHLSRESGKIPVVFMDSLDIDGNAYPDFRGLDTLPMEHLILVADDSHGIGIIGEDGGGVFRSLARLGARELIVCASLGKALGLQGGVVLCSSGNKASFWDTAFFAGASPAPPAHMATLIEAGKTFETQRKKLTANMRLFEEEWQNRAAFKYIPGHPVFTYNDTSLTLKLETHRILVTDFPYPSLQATAMNGRIVLGAHHQSDDIKLLAEVLNSSDRGK